LQFFFFFFFPPVVFPFDFFIAFLAVSLHEELKNTIKTFSEVRPENLKESQQKGRVVESRYVARRFFFSLSSAPLGGRAGAGD
jgi:hypothetical protein